MRFIPDLMTMRDGSPVTDWQARRREIIELFEENEFGRTPPVCGASRVEILSEEPKCCGGHAVLKELCFTLPTEKGEYSFPAHYFMNRRPGKRPLILFLNFRPDAYDRYAPIEEIIDHGFSVVSVCYKDISSDDGDMANGLAGQFTRPDTGDAYAKISVWAYALSRMLDALWDLPEIDNTNVTVAGHSRLGKTALWCAAQDERIKFAYSNGSGCAGAAYERVKSDERAETMDIINTNFPFWFCDNYRKYRKDAESLPFDQHMLIAAIAPRFVAVGSGSDDFWADPAGEQLSCIGASPAWEMQGLSGFVGPMPPCRTGDHFCEGHISYHKRDGVHFFSRRDWLPLMKFIEKNL